MKHWKTLALVSVSLTAASNASAGVLATENAVTIADDSAWSISNDGTSAKDGVCDVYPAQWSIRTGDPLALKIRSTTGYTARVFRMGFYGGGGAKLVAEKTGSADPQPYPSTDGELYKKYGLLAAGWHDSLSFDTSGWLPGLYWVRLDQSGSGKQAATLFVVREKAGEKWPILVILPFNTEQAYNAWPSAARGGKSLYAWNSSPGYPSETIGIAQAVKVSFDRPFLVGAGTADFTNYEYPFVRWIESQPDLDAAYATDMDIDADPSVLTGRKAIVMIGHSEYWTRKQFDAAIAARNAGVSLLSLSGDTINWQVRYEDSYKTLVGFKESADNSCPRDIDGCVDKSTGGCAYPLGQCKPEYFKSQTKDPEAVMGHDLLAAGNVEEAKKHLELVTSHWNTLYNDGKIDMRRPGLYLTGVQTAGIVQRPGSWGFPWCDWIITGSRDWWLYDGVTCDRIPGVGGYEIDSAATADKYYDPWRPIAGRDGVDVSQRRIGALVQAWDGANRGSASYYHHSSGSEVLGFSAMAFTWGLDDYAGRQNGTPGTDNACAKRMVRNALTRWTSGSVAPPPTFTDAGVEDVGPEQKPDGSTEPAPEAGGPPPVAEDASSPIQAAPVEASASGCGCSVPGATTATLGAGAAGLFAALAVMFRRRRR